MNESEKKCLFEAAEKIWELSWTQYFRSETHLFYDHNSITHQYLPTVEEINRSFPNTCGWGTGMEDSAISAGLWMTVICDRFDASGDWGMKAYADKVWTGMAALAQVARARGFIPRSICIEDRRSHYINSSRDQYTYYVHALWRFHRSPLADEAQRAAMRAIIADICARMEENIVPEKKYSICREDGEPGTTTEMWGRIWAHEWARLPMFYLVGWSLTGDEHWRELYRRYAWKAARESLALPITHHTAYAQLQAVFSLEPFSACCDSRGIKP